LGKELSQAATTMEDPFLDDLWGFCNGDLGRYAVNGGSLSCPEQVGSGQLRPTPTGVPRIVAGALPAATITGSFDLSFALASTTPNQEQQPAPALAFPQQPLPQQPLPQQPQAAPAPAASPSTATPTTTTTTATGSAAGDAPARPSSAAGGGGGAPAAGPLRGAAQRRFRQRQKDVFSQLEQQLAEKLLQVSLLAAENHELVVKADVLEKAVGCCDEQLSMIQEQLDAKGELLLPAAGLDATLVKVRGSRRWAAAAAPCLPPPPLRHAGLAALALAALARSRARPACATASAAQACAERTCSW
jgi:hypothetical protein